MRDRWDVHSTTEISIFIIAKTPCDQQHLFKLFYKNPFTEKPLVLDQFETLLKRGRALMSKLHSSPLLFCWLDISDSTERIPFWSHAISSIKSANIMWLPLNLFNKYAHVFIRNGSKSHSYLSSTSEIREHGSEGAAKIVLER